MTDEVSSINEFQIDIYRPGITRHCCVYERTQNSTPSSSGEHHILEIFERQTATNEQKKNIINCVLHGV